MSAVFAQGLLPGRLLVRLPSWLGDLVMSEPAVRALHGRYAQEGREAELSLAAPRHLLPLLEGALAGARRIPHEGRGGERPADWRGHDAALLLTGSFRSALCAWRAGIPRRIGQARDGRGLLLTDALHPALERGGVPLGLGRTGRVPRRLPRPYSGDCVELALLCGVPVADTRPRLVVSDGERAVAHARLARLGLGPGEAFALLSAGAPAGSAKAWPAESWAALVACFARDPGLPCVAVCGPGEEPALAPLARAGARVVVDPPAGLRELAALAALARVVVTTDSGPRHVAAAVGAPLVCAVGPSDPRHTADHLDLTRFVRDEVDCGPCHRARCPLAGERREACMRLAPERLHVAALELLRYHRGPAVS